MSIVSIILTKSKFQQNKMLAKLSEFHILPINPLSSSRDLTLINTSTSLLSVIRVRIVLDELNLHQNSD